MLYSKLKQIRDSKSTYHGLQNSFWKEFVERYPYLMTVDVAKVTNELQDELHTLYVQQ